MTCFRSKWIDHRCAVVGAAASAAHLPDQLGYFKPGDQLPTVRGLASRFPSTTTGDKAYLSLVSDGYLNRRAGAACSYAPRREMDEEYTKDADGIMSDCVAACRDLDCRWTTCRSMIRRSSRSRRTRASNPRSSGSRDGADRAGRRGTTERRRTSVMRVKTRRNEGDMPGGQGGVPSAARRAATARCPRGEHGDRRRARVEHGRAAVLGGVFLLASALRWALVGNRRHRRSAISTAPSALLATAAVHIAQQWEKVVVLRFGVQPRVGPGSVLDVPRHRAEHHARGHPRARTTFGAEETLTADLVPLDVNAAVLARVGCESGVHRGGRLHACRGAGGPDGCAMPSGARAWPRWPSAASSWIASSARAGGEGGAVGYNRAVGGDTRHPAAEGTRRCRWRPRPSSARRPASSSWKPSRTSADDGRHGRHLCEERRALRLRAMHLLYESVRETGGTVVVPSSFSEGFGDALGDAAKDVLGKGRAVMAQGDER
ncbi:MAG: hypothetical protein ACLSVD_05585 [Eggerthellaceae bacterium]